MNGLSKYDCLKNETGLDLILTLVSEEQACVYHLPANHKLTFAVNEVKTMVFVAYEKGTQNLVALTQFETLPQPCPPQSCYPILKDAATLAMKSGEPRMANDSKAADVAAY